MVNPDRTAPVLEREVWQHGTDALILQEADEEVPPHAGLLDIPRIERITGLRCLHSTPQHRWGPESRGFLGVILFASPEIEVANVTLLDLPGHCHRGAVIAECQRGKQAFRLIGTHLSLGQALRWAQLRTLCQYLFRQPPLPAVLVGDLNEWRPWGLALSPRLIGAAFKGPAKPTFPNNRPLLALDRVLATAPAKVVETRVLDGEGIRMASDHRPLWGRVSLGN